MRKDRLKALGLGGFAGFASGAMTKKPILGTAIGAAGGLGINELKKKTATDKRFKRMATGATLGSLGMLAATKGLKTNPTSFDLLNNLSGVLQLVLVLVDYTI